MSHIELVCVECGASHGADMHTLGCEACGSPLDVSYLDHDAHTASFGGLRMPVPFHADSPTVTMGEGQTPIVELPSISQEMGGVSVVAKLEFMNPTGSFKDRGTATMLSVAMEHGVRAVVEDSSGNAGASVSAYAARAGIAAHVFAPESAPEAKMGQIRVYDASTHPTPGPREASTEAAVDFQRRHGMVYASHNLSPYFVEGTKTFAYEVVTQMEAAPDHIVIPVGNGSLLLGAWKAYLELILQGAVSQMPKLHAIQAEAVMPLAAEFMGTRLEAWRNDHRRRDCRRQSSASSAVAQGAQGVRRHVARRHGCQHCRVAEETGFSGGHLRRADVGRGLRRASATRGARRGER